MPNNSCVIPRFNDVCVLPSRGGISLPCGSAMHVWHAYHTSPQTPDSDDGPDLLVAMLPAGIALGREGRGSKDPTVGRYRISCTI